MEFPVSGVAVSPVVPPLVAFAVSCVSAMGGRLRHPGGERTNLIYNVVATPGGVYRYSRERRMAWPLAWAIAAGTLPGVFLGAWIRARYLAEPRRIQVFAGMVLLCLAIRLLFTRGRKAGCPPASAGIGFFHLLGTRPDWLLGALFGIGGLAGTYAGARFQRYFPERPIRIVLGLSIAGPGNCVPFLTPLRLTSLS